jgi:N-acetylglucosamine kinase-like BadF-type ATPase
MKTVKEQVTELAKRLREAAKLGDPTARAAVELVQLICDDLKEKLVEANGEDMLRLQGAARQFRKIHTELTKTPATINQE